MNNKTQQDMQNLETATNKELENLRENLSIVMQSELRIMEKDISGTIQEMQKRLTGQIRILNISFAQRWLTNAFMAMSILLGLCLATWSILSLGEIKARNLYKQINSLSQQKQQLMQDVKALQDESWGISLRIMENGRFIVLPPQTTAETGWTVENQPAIKLE